MYLDKILLLSHVKYDDVVILNWSNLCISHVSMHDLDCEDNHFCGHFEFINSKFLAIFQYLNTLYLLYDNMLMHVDEIEIQLEKHNNTTYLNILDNAKKITLEQIFTDIDDDEITPFIDIEDFNFLIFVYNIVKSKHRQKIMYENC